MLPFLLGSYFSIAVACDHQVVVVLYWRPLLGRTTESPADKLAVRGRTIRTITHAFE